MKKKRKINIGCKRILNDPDGYKYQALSNYWYFSKRYKKFVCIEAGDKSDGATGAWDIYSDGWWIHDKICKTGCFEDGTKLSNFQASMILRDILLSEGRYFRSNSWLIATFLFGGEEARKNGMFKVKAR